MFRHPYVPTPLYSDTPMFRHPNVPKTEPIFRHPYVPRPLYFDTPMFRHPYVLTSYFRTLQVLHCINAKIKINKMLTER